MRLINTTTGELQEFFGSSVPPYAILSHTWEDDEVLYADILHGSATSKKGYAKVSSFCQMAKDVGCLDWAWVDTCCIDKESSAELSEAINSMYKWYEQSAVCYVYLQDVRTTGDQINANVPQIWTSAYPEIRLTAANFPQSRWFTRGWTLQELIAPRFVEFYTVDWTEIGTKRSLAPHISSITGIPIAILHGQGLSSCNIAERMSWASTRRTTREEDMAYCLLGLFNVNMPLLYGEGARSFIRLQEQILQQEEDYSIFAWTLEAENPFGDALMGVLASSPAQFAAKSRPNIHVPGFFGTFNDDWASRSLYEKNLESMPQDLDSQAGEEVSLLPYQAVQIRNHKRLHQQPFHSVMDPFPLAPPEPPQLTSRGLRLSLPIRRHGDPDLPALAWLYCEFDDRLLCIALRPSLTASSTQEARYNSSWLVSVDRSILRDFELEQLFLHTTGEIGTGLGHVPSPLQLPQEYPARLKIVLQNKAIQIVDCWPPVLLGGDEIFMLNTDNKVGIIACHCMVEPHSSDFHVCYGIMEGKPWCTILSETKPDHEVKRESVIKIGSQHTMEDIYELSGFSDRSSRLSTEIPNMVFTTSIRKVTSLSGIQAVFVLEISLLNWLHRSLWADLSLSQALLLPAQPHAVSPRPSRHRDSRILTPNKRNTMVGWNRILKTPGNLHEAVRIFEQIRQQSKSQLTIKQPEE